MDSSNTKPSSSQATQKGSATKDEGWTEVPTAVTRVIFEELGDSFTGHYIGSEVLNGDDGTFNQYLFRAKNDDGEDDLFGVFGSYSIDKGMDQVPDPDSGKVMVKISFTGTQDTGKPSPMRVFKVQYKVL